MVSAVDIFGVGKARLEPEVGEVVEFDSEELGVLDSTDPVELARAEPELVKAEPIGVEESGVIRR